MLFKKNAYVHGFTNTNSTEMSFRNNHELSLIIQTQKTPLIKSRAIFAAKQGGVIFIDLQVLVEVGLFNDIMVLIDFML